MAETLHNEGLQTTHLVSIGGWNAPHPDTSLSGEEWFQVWQEWNTNISVLAKHLNEFHLAGPQTAVLHMPWASSTSTTHLKYKYMVEYSFAVPVEHRQNSTNQLECPMHPHSATPVQSRIF